MLSSEQKDRLREAAQQFYAPLCDLQVVQFERLADMLCEWNQRFNLTAIRDMDGIVDKHFIDSLAANPHIADDAFVLDVGTGAGFPGLPLKIAKPSRRMVLIDASQKKVGFVQAVIRELGLTGISALHQRAEDAAFRFGLTDQFDTVIARAVAKATQLVPMLLPYAKKGGRIILYKGPMEAEAISRETWTGVHRPNIVPYRLPAGDERVLAIFEKT